MTSNTLKIRQQYSRGKLSLEFVNYVLKTYSHDEE